ETVALADTRTTFKYFKLGFDRICLQVSYPVMPGIMMSRRTRSGQKVSISSRASSPDVAVFSRYVSPSTSSMMEVLIGSSSTTRMASRLVMAMDGAGRLADENVWLRGTLRPDGQCKDERGSA